MIGPDMSLASVVAYLLPGTARVVDQLPLEVQLRMLAELRTFLTSMEETSPGLDPIEMSEVVDYFVDNWIEDYGDNHHEN